MKKILIIEDDHFYANNLKKEIVKNFNYIVDIVYSKEELEKVDTDEYCLVISDIIMKNYDEDYIKERFIKRKIPMILMTAYEENEKNQKLRKLNIIDFIMKTDSNQFNMFINKLKILNYLKDKKILIVDDSKTALLINLKAIRKFYPFTKVLTAINGVEALKCIEEHPEIKLIITDYEMPKMDGKTLIKTIRRKYNIDEKIIISISSTEELGLSSTLLKMGANDFLHKPFIEDELLCRIDNNMITAILLDEMKQMAYKDPLTSLFNRRYFFETAEKLYLTALREKREIAVLMCDIDHFKKINDNYGHDTGDIVIKNTAEILSSNIRKNDIVARYGGEEFVIFLYNCDIKFAYLIGEKIRYKINDIVLNDKKGNEIKYTISIGVSNQGERLEDIINNADKMLYMAKKTRNRVVAQKVKK